MDILEVWMVVKMKRLDEIDEAETGGYYDYPEPTDETQMGRVTNIKNPELRFLLNAEIPNEIAEKLKLHKPFFSRLVALSNLNGIRLRRLEVEYAIYTMLMKVGYENLALEELAKTLLYLQATRGENMRYSELLLMSKSETKQHVMQEIKQPTERRRWSIFGGRR